LRLRSFHIAVGALSLAVLCGCVATDPLLSSQATAPQGEGELIALSGSDESAAFAMTLPETVAVLPEPRGEGVQALEQTVSVKVATASYAASAERGIVEAPFPPAPAVRLASLPQGEEIFLQPLPGHVSAKTRPFQLPVVEGGSEEINRLIEKYAHLYDVPVQLVRRVVRRESNFNPSAFNRGHWGLMQIKHATARGMGYKGPPSGLLDPETNLKYAVRYLRGAWLVAEGNPDLADRLYQTGYYYHAKRKGLLDETGLRRDHRRRAPVLACNLC
jgi:hypothetical protein